MSTITSAAPRPPRRPAPRGPPRSAPRRRPTRPGAPGRPRRPGAPHPARPAHGLPGLAARGARRRDALGAGSVATEQPGTPSRPGWSMVATGDTLWGIAAATRRATATSAPWWSRIERLNALDSAMVAAGQRLRVPLTD